MTVKSQENIYEYYPAKIILYFNRQYSVSNKLANEDGLQVRVLLLTRGIFRTFPERGNFCSHRSRNKAPFTPSRVTRKLETRRRYRKRVNNTPDIDSLSESSDIRGAFPGGKYLEMIAPKCQI